MACATFWSFKPAPDSTDRITEIAGEYKSYRQLVDERMVVTDSAKYKWTIRLCRIPRPEEMGHHYERDSAFMSRANSAVSPHGDKLYKLFVKDYTAYLQNASAGQPVGQVIVKETWNVKEVSYDSSNETGAQVQSRNNGKWYTPTTPSELFVMYKEAPGELNDKGWNYGTYSLESGAPLLLNDFKRSTCFGCHKGTKYDRIFGVK